MFLSNPHTLLFRFFFCAFLVSTRARDSQDNCPEKKSAFRPTGGIWKWSFLNTVRPTMHSNPSRKSELFENEFQNAGFCSGVGVKHFENGIFRKGWRHDYHVISLPEFSSNAISKWPVRFQISPVWSERGLITGKKRQKFLEICEQSILKVTAIKMAFQSFNIRASICHPSKYTTKCTCR